MKTTQKQINQVKSKRPAKAAKVSGKVKAAPANVRLLGGAGSAKKTPLDHWEKETKGQLEETFEAEIGRIRLNPELEAKARKNWPDYLPKRVEEMAAIRAEKTKRWASMPPPSQADRQAAETECDELAAVILQREIEEKDIEQHRTTQAFGRRAFKALTLQDAGYFLAADVAVKVFPYPKKGSRDPNAPARNQLWISLEALSLWLQEFVEADGEKVPRWQTMPARSFRHHQRHSKYGWSESYIELNNAAGAWLWSEIGGAAHEDAHAGKALGYLLHRHQSAALEFLQRFLAARHSTQDKSRERMIDVAAAMESGNKDRLGKTSKKDRDRIRRDHKPPVE